MSLFVVTLAAPDGERYEVATLAHTELSARRQSAKAIGHTSGARLLGIRKVDPYSLGVVMIKKAPALSPVND